MSEHIIHERDEAIVTLSISVNLIADWALNRTTSLKGGRGA